MLRLKFKTIQWTFKSRNRLKSDRNKVSRKPERISGVFLFLLSNSLRKELTTERVKEGWRNKESDFWKKGWTKTKEAAWLTKEHIS